MRSQRLSDCLCCFGPVILSMPTPQADMNWPLASQGDSLFSYEGGGPQSAISPIRVLRAGRRFPPSSEIVPRGVLRMEQKAGPCFLPTQVYGILIKLAPGGLEVRRLEGEKQQVVPAEDRVFGNAGPLQRFDHLRPYLAMCLIVDFSRAFTQAENECKSFQRRSFFEIRL